MNWEDWQDNYLKENWNKISGKEIAKYLGKSYTLTKKRAQVLKISKPQNEIKQHETIKINDRFTRLIVVELPIKKLTKNDGSRWFVKLRCDCGTEIEIECRRILSGNTKSCGCYNSDIITKRNKENAKYPAGYTSEHLYKKWQTMKKRCYDTNYHAYLGGTIKVCDEWKNDYLLFREWALLNKLDDTNVICRIDLSKDYYPENCFVTSRSDLRQKLGTYDKVKNTLREKYGCDYIGQFSEFKISAAKTKIEKYGTLNLTNLSEQNSVRDFLLECGFEFISDYSILNGREIDLFNRQLNLGIEYSGIYWHSELRRKDKYYHYNKYIDCKENNVELITIFSDDWIYKKELVKQYIKYKLNLVDYIESQKLELKLEDNNLLKIFYNNNNLLSFNIIKYNNCSFITNVNFTYNYHILNIKYILDQIDDNIFILIDNLYPLDRYLISENFKIHKMLEPKFKIINIKDFSKRIDIKDYLLNEEYTRIWDCGSTVYKI